MKKIIIFILISTFTFDAFSQFLPKNIVYWNDNPISWKDINEIPYMESQMPYYIDIRIDLGFKKTERNDTIYYLNDFKIYYNPDLTWCIPEYRQDSILRIFQLLFDFSEYKKREIQKIGNRKRISPFILNYMSYELDTIFQKVYDYNNYETLDTYIDYYRKQIDNLEIEYYPNYSFKSSGFGVDFGLNGSVLSGSINNYLKNNLGANFNFFYYFKRNFLSFGLSFGFSGLKQEIPNTNYYPSNNIHANIVSQPLLYGREFRFNNKYLLYPMIGMSVKGIVSAVEGQEKSLSIWSKPSPCIGLKINFPYKKRVIFSSSQSKFFSKEFVQNDFSIRLLFERVNLSNDISGITTSIGVGYNMRAKPLKF
jgi:hypothetical protein